jgi:hypothetical protein
VRHVVKLRGYLPASPAAGGVRHRGVDPSTVGEEDGSRQVGPVEHEQRTLCMLE